MTFVLLCCDAAGNLIDCDVDSGLGALREAGSLECIRSVTAVSGGVGPF